MNNTKGSTFDADIIMHLEKMSMLLCICGTIFSYLVFDPIFSCGVMTGAVIALVNFDWLRRIVVRGCALGDPQKGKRWVVFRYYLRMGVIGLLIFLLISEKVVPPLSLLLGLSTVILSICGMGFFYLIKNMYKETV